MINIYDIRICDDKPMLKIIDEIDECEFDLNKFEIINIINEHYSINELFYEIMIIIAFDNTNCISGIYKLSKGSINECQCYNKSIVTFLSLLGNDRFLLIHNHPLASSRPSKADFDSFNTIKLLSEYLDYEFIDSLIIGKNSSFSICENKEITEGEYDYE